MIAQDYEARVFRSESDGFRALRNANVLIYWPHGFGDWVFLSHVLPLLEPSNRYYLTRFGDHNTSAMDGCRWATPLYTGQNTTWCKDGGDYGCFHLGLRETPEGGVKTLRLPLALHAACVRERIDAVVDLPFWETFGSAAFPFHTKARQMLRHLLSPERLAALDLDRVLPCGLNPEAPGFIRAWVESRLHSLAGWEGRKLCLIARGGYTSTTKNWGHRFREDMPAGRQREGEECRDFIRAMRRWDPEWLFVTIEDRLYTGDDTVRDRALGCVSYAELFGADEHTALPFGLVMKALASCADLAVGVPAGPYHLCMARAGLPTVGVWVEHCPSWYDEPKPEAIHVLSHNLLEAGLLGRVGSFLVQGGLEYRAHQLDTRIIHGVAVLEAAQELLGQASMRLGGGARGARIAEEGLPVTPPVIAVTIGVGEKYTLCAELAAKSCHRHTGLETYILGEDAVRRHGVAGPHFLKFKLFEEFPNAETILFFDADTIFLRAFDPALLAERPEWTCVCEPENSPWITEDAVRAGIATEEYFNSGFFIAHRRHHTGLLAEAERIAPGISSPFFEQTALNVARLRLGIAAHWLPAAYNRLDFANVLSVDGTVLAHVSGLGLWLPEEIRDYHRYWATRGNAPAEAARAAQSELSASAYEYDRIGHDFRRMTFLPGGLVADGAADAEKRWELADENGANVLWLTGHAQPTCYLLRDGRRGWRGRWIRQERMPVRLTVCGRLHPAEPKPVEVVLINRRRPRNIRFIVSALRVQREWCKVTLIDAAPTPDYATDEQTRDAVDRYVTIREHDGCNGFFLPLSRATAPFLYFHQDTALPGRYLLLAYLREMEAHPENGVLAQAGFTGGHFVRREILAEWWRLMLSNGEHDPMHLLETAARNAGFGAAVVRPRSPQESAGQQQLPQ